MLLSVLAQAQAPDTSATNLNIVPGSFNMDLTWTNGNGDRRIVIIRQKNRVNRNFLPQDSTTYTANSNYGLRSGVNGLGGGNFVVYDGTG